MSYQIITKAQQQRSEWTGGSTLQLQIHPANATLAERNFAWRLSSATVNQGGAFSQFTGFGRWLGIRQGAGLMLQIDDHRLALSRRSHLIWFSGDANTSAELIDGPVVDVNLILAPGWQGGMQAFEFSTDQQQLMLTSVADEFLLYVDFGKLLLTIDEQQFSLDAGEVLRGKVTELASSKLLARASSSSASAVLAWVSQD